MTAATEVFQIKRAVRENVRLLIGVAGGTGSGKTLSAFKIADGLANGEPFGVVDTENGRAQHYADQFTFDVVNLGPPYRPDRYRQAIQALIDHGCKVIVVDSASHEWEGEGGCLEWKDEIDGGNPAKNMIAWAIVKPAHRKLVGYITQAPVHIILCFRAQEKVDIGKDDRGKQTITPKVTPTGLNGWVPIAEKNLPYELTASFLLTADRPGIPQPIKLQEQHRLLIDLERPLSADVGAALGRWAKGGPADDPEMDARRQELVTELLEVADELGTRDGTTAAVSSNRKKAGPNLAAHIEWLERSLAGGMEKLAAKQAEEEQAFGDDPASESAEDIPVDGDPLPGMDS